MINNPAGLYGGGAFRVDSTAAVNYFLKRQAEEQAKEATLDKYFSTLTDKATPTGVRNQEQDAFRQSVQNYQDFYIANRKALAKGTDMALQSKARELAKLPFQIQAESKDALATVKTTGQVAATNPDTYATWTDETTGIDKESGKPKVDPNGNYMGIYAHDQPQYIINSDKSVTPNPQFKHFDLSSVKTNPKLLSTKELEDYSENQVSNIKPSDISAGFEPLAGKSVV